jgi:hypothetical protein
MLRKLFKSPGETVLRIFNVFAQIHQGGRACKAICGHIGSVFGKEITKFW